MKKFISKWSNWWILSPKRQQLDEAFKKELEELIRREVALRPAIAVEPVLTPVFDSLSEAIEKSNVKITNESNYDRTL